MTTFVRADGTPFWTVEPAAVACTVGYLPFDRGRAPGPSVSLVESWQRFPGTYLVAPAGTALDQDLAEALASFRAGRPLRLLWLRNPRHSPTRWQASYIASDGAVVTDLGCLESGSLGLWIAAGCAVGPDDAGTALVVEPRAGAPESIRLSTADGAWRLTASSPVTLSFAADQAGCAQVGLTLRNTGPGGDFTALDVGLRIFGPDPGAPDLPDRLTSWRYPVFAADQPGAAARLPVTFSLHPLLPLDPQRTYLRLVPAGSTAGTELASCYVTTNGLAVRLTPLARPGAPAREGRLVLALRALSDGPGEADPYYVVPSGAFRIAVVDAEGRPVGGEQRLMCGVSGIEYLLVEPGSELWFSPGGPALLAGKGLGSHATSAYASVFGPDGAPGRRYRAQAEGAALFQPDGIDGFLSFRELGGVTLPGAPPGGALPAGYPMLPFTGIDDTDVEPYRRPEFQAVAAVRRALIGALAAGTATAAADTTPLDLTTVSITPQGLLADVDGRGELVNLTLARSPAGPIRLGRVTADLAAAVQSSQLFLVASDPSTLCAAPPTDATVEIAGPAAVPGDDWSIDVWPGGPWSTTGTLLVLKFADKPLSLLAADTEAWAGDKGARFNPGSDGPRAAQAVLTGLIEQARTRKDPDFAAFAALAEDPGWQGVLFLNAPVPPAKLPREIAGIAAGIDAVAFKAHHLGVTVTPAAVAGGAITPADSSVFGLISYQSPTTAAGAPPPYAFNVRNLKVRFENSTVHTFASQIELLVDELFGEPATLVDPIGMQPVQDGVLLLDGVFQQHGNTGGYAFTTHTDNLFELESAVLDTVEVTAAQFVTVIPPDPDAPDRPAQSRFVLTGALRFRPAELDVFSFGPVDAATPAARVSPQQLCYTNLWINLDYRPADRSTDRYTFDAAQLVPDPVRSLSRETGLFAGFPLTPAGFVHVPAQPGAHPGRPATPAGLGYLGIETIPPLGGTITAPWFGIVADLGFGTAGALAAQAGFKAGLLLSWSPGGPRQANAGIGLKLPGSGSGGRTLTLQGVLKLKVGALTLRRVERAYLLELDRVALSVLMLTVPSAGRLDALLFADPTGRDHTTLGWYAGYAKTGEN